MLDFRIKLSRYKPRPDNHLVISLQIVIKYPKISLTYKIVVRHNISVRDLVSIFMTFTL